MDKIADFFRSLLKEVFRSLRRNFGLALLALALAFTLYIFVTDSENSVRAGVLPLNIPIEAVNVPTDVAVAGFHPKEVRVRVEVEEDVWDSLAVEDFEATADVINLPEGRHELSVEVVPLRSPGNLRVTQVIPEPVAVVLTPLFSKSVPVIIDTVGGPQLGYGLGKPDPEASEVIVSGPGELVSLVASVSATVEIDGAASDIDRAFRLLARDGRDQRVEGVVVEPSVMNVRIPIQVVLRELLIEPTIEGAPAVGFNVTGFSVSPTVISVIPDGDTLAGIRAVATHPVNIQDAQRNVVRTVTLDLPAGLTLDRIGQRQAEVTVRIEPALGQLPFVVQLQQRGLGANLAVEGLPPTVEVLLSGELPSLRMVQPGQIDAFVLLDDLEAGTHTLDVVVTSPTGVAGTSVTPSELTVIVVEVADPEIAESNGLAPVEQEQ